MRSLLRGVLIAAGVLATAVGTATALAADDGLKAQLPMLTVASVTDPGNRELDVTITPLLTVGDKLPGGYQFEAIPDGISVAAGRGGGDDDDDGDNRRVDIYVNHETSTVPFPFNPGALPEANQNDFDNSQVSLLTLDRRTAAPLRGKLVIKSAENFQRFCSNYLATRKEGFDRPILFTNEEAQDVVRRRGTAWVAPGIGLNTPNAEQPGVVVAYDVRTGKHKPIYGMGRHDHENSVAVPLPESDNVVLLSGDDSFMTAPVTGFSEAWSQVYAYIADDREEVWEDEGDLWAFVSDDPLRQNYYDFAMGDKTKIKGHFIKVPKRVATGKKRDGTELTSSDFPGMAAPPAGPPPPVGVPPDGPNWVLDQWGNAANNTYKENVFRFVRVEDMAYDKRRGMSNVVYIADSGLGSSGPTGPRKSTNGRIWKMVLNEEDPTKVDELSILVEGDNNPVKTLDEIHQVDNVETTANGSLLIQEDPGSSQQFVEADWGLPNATTARIWRVDLRAADPDGSKEVVARVDQGADEGPTDVDGERGVTARSRWGAWESSGIVDTSSVFGPGTFLVDVQAHTLWIEKKDGPDVLSTITGPDFTYKREGGQLLLIKVPGA